MPSNVEIKARVADLPALISSRKKENTPGSQRGNETGGRLSGAEIRLHTGNFSTVRIQ
jgi:hypothetical protein